MAPSSARQQLKKCGNDCPVTLRPLFAIYSAPLVLVRANGNQSLSQGIQSLSTV